MIEKLVRKFLSTNDGTFYDLHWIENLENISIQFIKESYCHSTYLIYSTEEQKFIGKFNPNHLKSSDVNELNRKWLIELRKIKLDEINRRSVFYFFYFENIPYLCINKRG